MKLLLDHNISHKLVYQLSDVFPDSTQTRLLNFNRTNDSLLWYYARTHGYVLVTKDSDVAEFAILRGSPPKVIWLRTGNCRTAVVEDVLRRNLDAIRTFVNDSDRAVLELFE